MRADLLKIYIGEQKLLYDKQDKSLDYKYNI